jgi:hypothetical protein
MSVLRFPRVHLSGEVAWDPGLANNSRLFDAERVELTPPEGVPFDQLKPFIIQNLAGLGIWNYYGTHDATFQDVTITSGLTGPGQPLVTDDPLVGKRVTLQGKLVDLDAATVHGSQIFLDRVTIGDTGVGMRAGRPQRLHARWINFGRNLDLLPIAGIAAVVWQTVMPKDTVQLSGAPQSPLLSALAEGLARDDALGLMLRFQTYRTLYFQNGIRNSIPQQPRTIDELRQLYEQGLNFSNPAYSVMVGALGLWLRDEPRTWPGGRYLAPAEPVAMARRRGQSGAVVSVPVPTGPAVCEVDEVARLLSLDLSSCVPETDANLEKTDLGALELRVEGADGQSALVASIPPAVYGRQAYEERAGIVDLALDGHDDPDIIAKVRVGRLVLRCRPAGEQHERTALIEAPLVAAADQRDIYLDEGEEKTARLAVLSAAGVAPSGTRVLVSLHDRAGTLVAPGPILEVGADGAAELPVRAETPGFVTYRLAPFAKSEAQPTPPAELDTTSDFFVNVRTLPFDDAFEQGTPDSALTWEFVYDRVLRVYDTLNPVMSRTPSIGKPLDDRDRMETLAFAIKRVIAKDLLESPDAMPVTRDLSAGRRRLLERWCNLVISGPALFAAASPRTSEAAEDVLPRDPRRAL